MKKFLVKIVMLASVLTYAQDLPIAFEDPTFTDFDGGQVTIVSNPVSNGNNNSVKVGQMVKNPGQIWAGSLTTLDYNLDFVNNNTFSMKVYSIKSGTKVLLKVEDSSNQSIFHQKEVEMTTTSDWETLVFDFSDIDTNNNYNQVVLIFDNGIVGDGSANFTYYFDDLSLYYQAPATCSGSTGNIPGSDYTLVWADEFSEDGAPCPNNWTYDIGAGGWGNGESQYYTSSLNNSYVQNGVLTIKAIKENFGGSQYTSARLKSEGLYDFAYGKVDVRAKLPGDQGTWPAIWMLGANFSTVGWPHCGEIDIMEQYGNNKSITLGTVHWFDGGHTFEGLNTPISNASTQYHIYSLEWTPQSVKVLLDGVAFFEKANNGSLPFNHNFFLILNIAMGGTLGGAIDPAFVDDVMEIDYVRVYQKTTRSNYWGY